MNKPHRDSLAEAAAHDLHTNEPQHRAEREVRLYWRLARQVRPYWLSIAGLFLLSVLSTPLALLTPLPLKFVVDSVIGSRPLPETVHALFPETWLATRPSILILATITVVVVAFLSQVQRLATAALHATTAGRLVQAFRAQLFHRAMQQSPLEHERKGVADAAYVIQKDADSLQYIVLDGAIPLVVSAITLASMLFVVVQLDWQLSLVALVVSPVLFFLTRHYRLNLRRRARRARQLEGQSIGVVYEALAALRVVKAFGQEAREQDRFARKAESGVRERIRLAVTQSGLDLLVAVATAGGTAAILFIGTRHVLSGELLLGELLLIMSYLTQLYEPMKMISRKIASLQGHLVSAERAFALVDEPEAVPEHEQARPLIRCRGALILENVTFAYASGPPILRNVSLSVAPGQRVGIAGPTGAGKTTFLNLLTRFFDPTSGRILLDGVDIREYRLSDLRDQFAIVQQEPVLFSTSIAENIAYGRPAASRSQILEAARAADAHGFIEALPDGLATSVGERGMRLSGGERQRIALARAFLKDAPILILDEPTSSVDMRTEASILEAMDRLSRGRTTFMVAHRLATLSQCDVILRIESDGSAAPSSSAELKLASAAPAPPSSLVCGPGPGFQAPNKAHRDDAT